MLNSTAHNFGRVPGKRNVSSIPFFSLSLSFSALKLCSHSKIYKAFPLLHIKWREKTVNPKEISEISLQKCWLSCSFLNESNLFFFLSRKSFWQNHRVKSSNQLDDLDSPTADHMRSIVHAARMRSKDPVFIFWFSDMCVCATYTDVCLRGW